MPRSLALEGMALSCPFYTQDLLLYLGPYRSTTRGLLQRTGSLLLQVLLLTKQMKETNTPALASIGPTTKLFPSLLQMEATNTSALALINLSPDLFLSLLQVLLLIKQMEATNTPALASKVSLVTIGQQAVMDSYLCLLHLTTGTSSTPTADVSQKKLNSRL